jgi:hypothetical protein
MKLKLSNRCSSGSFIRQSELVAQAREMSLEKPKHCLQSLLVGRCGKIDQALQVAKEIKNEARENMVLSEIVFGCFIGKFNQALQVAKKIKEESSKDSLCLA